MISTSKKLITIHRIENFSCDSMITAANRQRNRGPAQQCDKRKVERRPGQHEYCRPDPVIFGPRQNADRDEVKRRENADAEPTAAGETFLGRDVA
jgi:hypothetical protein